MFKKFIRKFFSEKGQALIEYVLIISLISIATVGALSAAGVSVSNIYSNIAEKFDGGGSDPVDPTDPYDIAGCTISEIGDQTYTGAAIEPEFTVTTGEGTPLTLNTDYTVAYENNTEVGEATVTITGTGDWHGSKTSSFDIVAVVIDTVPSQDGTLSYTGSEQTPTWSNYDSAKLALAGVTSGTGVAEYTATFTPKAGYTWSDGTRTAKEVKWKIVATKITAVPSQSGTLNYSASTQTPSWSNYDSAKLTLGGETSGRLPVEYTATFTPRDGYTWEDGTKVAKTVKWSIDGVKYYTDYALKNETDDISNAVVVVCEPYLKWGGFGTDQPGVSEDETAANGLANTNWILSNTTLGTTSGTIWQFCTDMRTVSGNNINWYVPAAKELWTNIPIPTIWTTNFWSSTESQGEAATHAKFPGAPDLNLSQYKTDIHSVALFR